MCAANQECADQTAIRQDQSVEADSNSADQPGAFAADGGNRRAGGDDRIE
jgi:hypothetical protein